MHSLSDCVMKGLCQCSYTSNRTLACRKKGMNLPSLNGQAKKIPMRPGHSIAGCRQPSASANASAAGGGGALALGAWEYTPGG